MTFEREYELVRALASEAASLWPGAEGKPRLRAERGYGRGVADLVVLGIDGASLAERRERGLPPARRSGEAQVLQTVIDCTGHPVDVIINRVPMTRGHVRRLLCQLEQVGLIVINDDGTVAPTWPARPVVSRVTAIEAKLTDWRAAAVQAERYLDFADQAYIAMPQRQITALLQRPDRLAGLGLGLIAVADDGCAIALAAETAAPRKPSIRRWLDEVEYADLIGEARPLVPPFPARFAHPTPAELVID